MMHIVNCLKSLPCRVTPGLLCILLLSPCSFSVYAVDIAPVDVSLEAELDQDNDDIDEDFFPVTPVEIGPSGNIRKENVYRSLVELKYPVHLHALWESRYITEGRDNLQGDSLVSFSTEFSISSFTFAPWMALSPDRDYEEVNLNFIYGMQISEMIELYASYSYLHAWEDSADGSDNELALELAFVLGDVANLSAGWVHSTEADGNYYELALRREYNFNSHLTLNGGIIVGINQGYIVDGHNGVDHAQIRVGMAYHRWDRIELVAYLSHSHAIDRSDDSAGDFNLKNYNLAGAGLAYRF